MFRNMLFAAVLTLSAFAATGAHAAAGQVGQPQFAAASGSYGFTVYPQCKTPKYSLLQYCRAVCQGFPTVAACAISYQAPANKNRRMGANEMRGFTQGKFHSK
jgi:hypothetical protein